MTKALVSAKEITRYSKGKLTTSPDLLAEEEPMQIRLRFGKEHERQQKDIAVTMRTPGNDFELAIGFLFTEGIISSFSEVKTIKYCTDLNTQEQTDNLVRVDLMPDITPDMDKLARNFYTTSSCGVCGKESIASIEAVCPYPVVKTSLAIDAHQILLLPNKLRKAQAVFEHTGGLHACALFSALGELHLVREDVGRHNAMDKLIGACLSSKVYSFPLSESIVLLSGRASFELMQKAAMAGVRMICAVGAPSSMAVHLAQKFDITLIGFLRDDRFNIYHGAERILN